MNNKIIATGLIAVVLALAVASMVSVNGHQAFAFKNLNARQHCEDRAQCAQVNQQNNGDLNDEFQTGNDVSGGITLSR